MTSVDGFAKFVGILMVWAAGSTVLYFMSLLSVSTAIINTMLGIAAVCLVGSLAMFFTGRHSIAFVIASGPFLTLCAIFGLGMLLG